MKKIYTFLFLLLVFALGAGAQNAHWSYRLQNQNTYESSSAVTIIRSNGEAYIAHVEKDTNILRLAKIDPTTMLTTGNNYNFSPSSSKKRILLRGGFESLDGKIVLYGCCYDTAEYNHGYVAVIDLGVSIPLFYFEPTGGSIITKGCSGYDINGNVVNLFVFNEGNLFALEQNNTNLAGLFYPGPEGGFSDVAWSFDNNCFVASGCRQNTTTGMMDPFIHCFIYNPVIAPQPFQPLSSPYAVAHNAINDWATGQSFISLLNDNHLVLYQDLRKGEYDVIWLTLVKDYTSPPPSFPKSSFFYVPLHKLSAYGMVFDTKHTRLNLLGLFDYCRHSTTFLAQTDPFNLSFLNVRQIVGPTPLSSCTTWATPFQQVLGDSVRLNNITFNPHNPCYTVISTGTAKISNKVVPFLTEALDVSLSACDIPFSVPIHHCTPTTDTVTILDTLFQFFSYAAVFQTPDTAISYLECKDVINCSKGDGDWETENTKTLKSQEAEVLTFTNTGHFVCYGFQDVIQYQVFDLTGKLVCKGETTNGFSNSIITKKCGLYFIRCMDSAGNAVTTKVIINR